MDLTKATEALYTSDDPLVQARVKAVLEGAPAPEAILEAIAAQQNNDGGWPLNGILGNPSSIEDTVERLLLLLELDEQGHPMVAKAETWLVARQAPKGWFREPQNLIAHQPPLWADPQSDDTLAYTSARAAAALALLGEHALALDTATMWLQSQVGPQGLLPGFRILATAWAIPALALFNHRETRSVKRMISGLGDTLSAEWDSTLLATVLTCLSLAKFPRATRLVERILEQLTPLQADDGTWFNEADESDLGLTLHIVRAGRRFGLR